MDIEVEISRERVWTHAEWKEAPFDRVIIIIHHKDDREVTQTKPQIDWTNAKPVTTAQRSALPSLNEHSFRPSWAPRLSEYRKQLSIVPHFFPWLPGFLGQSEVLALQVEMHRRTLAKGGEKQTQHTRSDMFEKRRLGHRNMKSMGNEDQSKGGGGNGG